MTDRADSPGLETAELDSATARDSSATKQAPKRDAFSELLAPKPKHPKPSTSPHHPHPHPPRRGGGPRDSLGAYIAHPEAYPPSAVIYHNASFVAIRDLFPKSSVHLLLLPRDRTKTLLHPLVALQDPVFLSTVLAETQKLRALAAAELRRLYGRDSAAETRRQVALRAEEPPAELPAGRDWESEIRVGIHGHPSMNHLHIHVISVDRYSERLKHRKHYNSFATPFFVPVEEFPLAEDDERRDPDKQGYLRWELRCWRCGRGFGSRFAELKAHLEREFDEWKRL